MLCITNDGRKLALDQRLMNSMLPENPDSKANVAAAHIFRHWELGKDDRLTQICFCDLSTPKKDGSFNVYNDLRQKLIDRGIPEEEIAFIHSADTEIKKKELFAKVRQGKIRILMGSTFKCGSGMNIQDKLRVIHRLDVPWKPSSIQQQNGRAIRQGNSNDEVDIYTYVTEKTFDAYSWQLIETKQKFISQIMTSKSPMRSCSDVDEQALSYAEIKALATGNPLIIEKCDLEMQVNKLKLLKGEHLSQQYALEDKLLKYYPQEIVLCNGLIDACKRDMDHLAAHTTPEFVSMIVSGVVFTDKKAAGAAILEACKAMTSQKPVPLGEYRGFKMELYFEPLFKEYKVDLKQNLTLTIFLSEDIFGNIMRIDNVLDGLPNRLKTFERRLETAQTQMEAAKAEVNTPFLQEAELAEKSARLAEVNSKLNLDERENEVVDDVPDEGEIAVPERNKDDRER